MTTLEYEHVDLPAHNLYARTPDLAISLNTQSLAGIFNAQPSAFVRQDLGEWRGFTVTLNKSLKITFANSAHDTPEYGAMMWVDIEPGTEKQSFRALATLSDHVRGQIAFCDSGKLIR
jgi:hypothetical protein